MRVTGRRPNEPELQPQRTSLSLPDLPDKAEAMGHANATGQPPITLQTAAAVASTETPGESTQEADHGIVRHAGRRMRTIWEPRG